MQQQIQSSFAVIDRQFRLQRDQLEEQDKQAKSRVLAERKAQCIKDLVEALADYEEMSEEHSDNMSAAAFIAALQAGVQLQTLPTPANFDKREALDQAYYSSASKVANARSKLRS